MLNFISISKPRENVKKLKVISKCTKMYNASEFTILINFNQTLQRILIFSACLEEFL